MSHLYSRPNRRCVSWRSRLYGSSGCRRVGQLHEWSWSDNSSSCSELLTQAHNYDCCYVARRHCVINQTTAAVKLVRRRSTHQLSTGGYGVISSPQKHTMSSIHHFSTVTAELHNCIHRRDPGNSPLRHFPL